MSGKKAATTEELPRTGGGRLPPDVLWGSFPQPMPYAGVSSPSLITGAVMKKPAFV
jgi:hypothetical protein